MVDHIVVQADAKWAFIDGTERGTVGRRNLWRHGAGPGRAGERKKLDRIENARGGEQAAVLESRIGNGSRAQASRG